MTVLTCTRGATAAPPALGGGAPRRVAVVGSGASGCYAVEALLKVDPTVQVDVIERLPTPFGLIRYGVAPDHPGTKAVMRTLGRVLGQPRVAFLGSVVVGQHVQLAELRSRYDGVILATGADRDRRLGLPGEGLDGVVGSGRLAAWYNDHPLADDLSQRIRQARDVLIVGAGNVALDAARLLARQDGFDGSDLSEGVLAALSCRRDRRVVIAGRRDLARARFSVGELRELLRIAPGRVRLEAPSRVAIPEAAASPMVQLLLSLPDAPTHAPGTEEGSSIEFRFDCRPVALLPAPDRPREIGAVALQRLRGGVVTEEIRPFDLVLTCIGYEHASTFDLPTSQGALAHDDGRIDEGLYVVGWAKRGAEGAIGTHRSDSHRTAARLLAELSSHARHRAHAAGIAPLLAERDVRWVDLVGRQPCMTA